MATQNKVSNKGFVTSTVSASTNTLVVENLDVNITNSKFTKAPVFKISNALSASTGTNTTISAAPLVSVSGTFCTATLPAINEGMLGHTLRVVAVSPDAWLLTGSNGINGGTWTRTIVSAHQWKPMTLTAVSSSILGFQWAATSGSLIG